MEASNLEHDHQHNHDHHDFLVQEGDSEKEPSVSVFPRIWRKVWGEKLVPVAAFEEENVESDELEKWLRSGDTQYKNWVQFRSSRVERVFCLFHHHTFLSSMRAIVIACTVMWILFLLEDIVEKSFTKAIIRFSSFFCYLVCMVLLFIKRIHVTHFQLIGSLFALVALIAVACFNWFTPSYSSHLTTSTVLTAAFGLYMRFPYLVAVSVLVLGIFPALVLLHDDPLKFNTEHVSTVLDIRIPWIFVALLMGFMLLASYRFERQLRSAFRTQITTMLESNRITSKLLACLPASIVLKLQKQGYRQNHGESRFIANEYKDVTVLFVVMGNLNSIMKVLKNDQEVVELLNECWYAFDNCLENHPVAYKVETVGPCYMISIGVPFESDMAPYHSLAVSRDLMVASESISKRFLSDLNLPVPEFRFGVNIGNVVGGVIGKKLPRFRLFGDVVNTASRMQSRGVAGSLQTTQCFYEAACTSMGGKIVVDKILELRGEIDVKGKGKMTTYIASFDRLRNMEAILGESDPLCILTKSKQDSYRILDLKTRLKWAIKLSNRSVSISHRKETIPKDKRKSDDCTTEESNPLLDQAEKHHHCLHSYSLRYRESELAVSYLSSLGLKAFWRIQFWLMGVSLCQGIAASVLDFYNIIRDRYSPHEDYFFWVLLLLRALPLLIAFGTPLVFFIVSSKKSAQPRPILILRIIVFSSICIHALTNFFAIAIFQYSLRIYLMLQLVCLVGIQTFFYIPFRWTLPFSLLSTCSVVGISLIDGVDIFSTLVFVVCVILGLMKERVAERMRKMQHESICTRETLQTQRQELLDDLLPKHVNTELKKLEEDKELEEEIELEEEKGLNEEDVEIDIPLRRQRSISTVPLVAIDQGEEVVVIFTDLVGFTAMSATLSAHALCHLIDKVFSQFDELSENYSIWKVETIGDAWFGVAGMPWQEKLKKNSACAAELAVRYCIEMVRSLEEVEAEPALKMRCGVYLGNVVAGVVGKSMPRYHLFGETVGLAEKLEETGVPMKVHVSNSVKVAIKKQKRKKRTKEKPLKFKKYDCGEPSVGKTWLVET